MVENKTIAQKPASVKTNTASIITTPKWIEGFPMVMIGEWDMKPLFRKRLGGSPEWMDDLYAKQNTEERVKQFKEAGATFIMVHFYKGFGLQAEKSEIDSTRKLVKLCRKYGLKVGAYVGPTIAYETFLSEMPEAKQWFPPDFMGRAVTYGSQTFRKLVYFQYDSYKAYIKRVLKIAVQDIGVDLIHFDNSSIQAIPAVFYHPLAVENFRKYLQNKYSAEQLKSRLGFSNVQYIEPPVYTKDILVLNDPLAQEWTDFRCKQLADYYNEMAQYIQRLNPQVAVECNPHGLDGRNMMWNESIDFPQLLKSTQFFWTEGEQTGLTKDNVLLSKIRTFKMAETLNNRVFTNTTGNRLQMAECLAYNRESIGMIGGLSEMEGGNYKEPYTLPDDQKAYVQFFKEHFDYYTQTKSIADVAVLHTYATMAYSNERPYQSTFLYEQSLIQGKIPFDIIFDDQLKNLSRYKVLILADQECLSDEQIALIKNFVQNGGGLVVTEHTSLYNKRHQRKKNFGLYDLIKVDAPTWISAGKPETILPITEKRNAIGNGRVSYIPEIKPAIAKPAGVPMSGKYFKLALNHQALIDAVKWASGNSLSLQIEAPQTVTMELRTQENKHRLLLHLVNYNYEKEAVNNIHICMSVPQNKSVQQIRLLSPDKKETETITFQQKNGEVSFIIPQLMVYDLAVIRLQ